MGSCNVIADTVQRIESNEGSCLQAASLVQPGTGHSLHVCVYVCVCGDLELCILGNKAS